LSASDSISCNCALWKNLPFSSPRTGSTLTLLIPALVAVRAEPLRESANRVVAQVHLLEGNRLEALRQFKRYEELLEHELGAEPSPEFGALVSASAWRSMPTG
jgi:hypothetical protein